MSYRPERLAEVIKKEMSDLLLGELKDPRVGFATITDVTVSNDLKYAKIYVSVLGEPEQKNSTLQGLQKALGFVRTELGRRIRLRQVPEISFKLDQSLDQGARIMELLNEVKSSDE